MLILGLDPGTIRSNPTGWALVDTAALQVVKWGLLRPESDGDFVAHITQIAELYGDQVLAQLRIERVGIEFAHIGANPQSGLKLAALVGALLARSAQAGLPVRLVQPAQAKRALSAADSSKGAMQRSVKMYFGMTEDVPEHVADAIGVALACATYEVTE